MKQLPHLPPVMSAIDLAHLIDEHPSVRLLDVRTPGEYEAAHIRGAYNVPLDRLSEHAREIRSTVEAPVVLVCQSGQRARVAEEALRRAGMPNLHVLDGGVNGWRTSGGTLVHGAPRMSLERQVRIAAGALAAAGAILALTINPLFATVPAVVGSGLVFAGITDTCMLGMLLARLPHNRAPACDVSAMVRALSDGAPPVPTGRRSSRASQATYPAC